MHQIERLLHTLAPKGVEFRKLGEVLEYDQPNKYCVTSKEFDKSYPTPVLTAGKTFILGYTNEKDNIYQASKNAPVIIFDDFTTATQWVDFPFKVKSSAMKILLPKNPTINIRFIFFYMQTIPYNISGEHTRQWISRYSQLEVPIPPLEIQQEIVTILDAFTELNTELKARKKQYQYYQNMLLDFNDINQNRKDAKERLVQKPYPKRLKTLLQTLAPKGVEFKKIGELFKRNKGINITAAQMKELHSDIGKVRIFAGGATKADINYKDISKKDIINCESVIIKSRGNIGFEYYNQPFSHKNEIWSYSSKTNQMLVKFLYYYLSNNQYYFQKLAQSSSVKLPQLSVSDTDEYEVPVPPLEIQQEIVKILDQFLALTTDLLAGIPAEIEARKKQYEYYREKLLTFKPLTPNKEVKKG
ncbi:restriction endonuclease subunit S [Helicobacter pylori]|uniref:restriction endonuclease subunit S n=1 Tax=Helicobacter pylori TaxID=210 RepID=UPI0013F43977|nr:restriction endonuclease subunit S [Helicobacter pylori]NHB48467.1 restriction endonuclease subunit S [Helicobacter pylori]